MADRQIMTFFSDDSSFFSSCDVFFVLYFQLSLISFVLLYSRISELKAWQKKLEYNNIQKQPYAIRTLNHVLHRNIA